jgi:hypothetical protein
MMETQPSVQPLVKQLPHTLNSGLSLSRPPGQGFRETSKSDDNPFPDALLYIYLTNMAPQFPFVVVPDRVSAAELAQTKPFLYRTIIMAASYHDKAGQVEMTKEIFHYLSDQMVIVNEKSLDLLQGLLVLMAWSVM